MLGSLNEASTMLLHGAQTDMVTSILSPQAQHRPGTLFAVVITSA